MRPGRANTTGGLYNYYTRTIDGLHEDPPMMFTEDYQVELLMAYFSVFDEYRKKFFIGELIWNYTDFMIQQSPQTFNGNRRDCLLVSGNQRLQPGLSEVSSTSCKGTRLPS